MSIAHIAPATTTRRDQQFEMSLDPELLIGMRKHPAAPRTVVELERLQHTLRAQGMDERTAARVVAVVLRYAFLVSGPNHRANALLWRLHFSDRVPLSHLTTLTWWQVRLYLREIAVSGSTTPQYFDLSETTCRLLRQLKERTRHESGASSIESELLFRQADGQPWTTSELAEILSPQHRTLPAHAPER